MAKTAGIVVIGNEILSGKIIDTNAVHLCRELRALGVEIRRISVIPDEVDVICQEVAECSRSYEFVFTSGGVGPTHDDVTIEGVARALGVSVVRDPRLVGLLDQHYKGKLSDARLKMAEIPEGAELVASDSLVFPAIVIRNVYILPGVPEIFRQKFEAIKERFREQPYCLASVFVRMGEATLAEFLNDLLAAHPLLILGSYPEFFNPEYKVKVTLESKDRAYLDKALAEFLDRLPNEAVVKVE
ncbi:MAG: competence/damage-inducible protein A [Candidatus Methylomirabilia bacterium]